jgi:Protein of unknown function (DUF2934)
MSFSVEVTPRQGSSGTTGHAVIVTINGHETVLTFLSKDHAEGFAQVERARLTENEKNASQRVREIAYRLWEEEGCPQGDALRHWFAATTLFERDKGP